jgi:cytochrome b involved in lipid metabolism
MLSCCSLQVYDVRAFRKAHPGGAMFPSFFGGRDATLAFATYHCRAWPEAVMTPYYVGELDSSCTPVKVGKEYYELAALVKTALRGRSGFAPKSYFVKVCKCLQLFNLYSFTIRRRLQCVALGTQEACS